MFSYSIKKVFIAGLAAAAVLVPLAVSAQSVATIQSKTGGCIFNRDMTIGLRGDDVQCLQEYLIKGGFLKVSATGYFGLLTRSAVISWQAAHAVLARGYFGAISRGVYNGYNQQSTFAFDSYQTKESCEQATGYECEPWMCDYVPPGKTFAQVCPNGGSGWSRTTIRKPVISTPVCAQVLKQCPDGSLVGYATGTCQYLSCPQPTTAPTSSAINQPSISGGAAVSSGSFGGLLNQKLAVFSISNYAGGSVKISDLSFKKDKNTGLILQNLRVVIAGSFGGNQFGVTQTAVMDDEKIVVTAVYPVTISKRQAITVEVYADILAGSLPSKYLSVIDLVDWGATKSKSGASIAFPGTQPGQDLLLYEKYSTLEGSVPAGVSLTSLDGS